MCLTFWGQIMTVFFYRNITILIDSRITLYKRVSYCINRESIWIQPAVTDHGLKAFRSQFGVDTEENDNSAPGKGSLRSFLIELVQYGTAIPQRHRYSSIYSMVPKSKSVLRLLPENRKLGAERGPDNPRQRIRFSHDRKVFHIRPEYFSHCRQKHSDNSDTGPRSSGCTSTAEKPFHVKQVFMPCMRFE